MQQNFWLLKREFPPRLTPPPPAAFHSLPPVLAVPSAHHQRYAAVLNVWFIGI